MTELSSALNRVIQDPTGLLIALDFDGTLAPFHDVPSSARMTSEAVSALERLAAMNIRLALVSGRGVEDLARVAQVPFGTVLIGSHGAERARLLHAGLDRSVAPLLPVQADLLTSVAARLTKVARGRDGVWVEAKPTAAVVHTRLARPDIGQQALEQARHLGEELGLHILEGKNVIELCVLPANKGAAVSTLKTDFAAKVVLFAGDDRTDESVFETLGPADIGIKVGPGASSARYRVDGPQFMATVLTQLADGFESRDTPKGAL